MEACVILWVVLLFAVIGWFLFGGANRGALADELLAAPPPAVPDLLARHASGAQLEGLRRAVRALSIDDRLAERPDLVAALVERAPAQALDVALELAARGVRGPAREACLAVLRDQPGHVAAREGLAELLLAEGELDAAERVLSAGDRGEPRFALLRVRLLLERGDRDGAIALLREVGTTAEARARGDLGFADPYWTGIRDAAEQLRVTLLRDLEGDEAVLRDAAASGKLLPRSGVNHALVGAAAMARSPRIAERLELVSVDVAFAEAERTLARDPRARTARVRMGEAHLRLADLAEARRWFQRLVEEDPGFFPGQLGLGAALLLEEHRAPAALRALPDEPLDPAWAPVIPDLPVLTRDERRVVAVSVAPLWRALPGLTAAGASIRLLPIDVRPTDRPELAAFEGARIDTRAVAAVGGLATSEGHAVARIEQLLDTCSDQAFVFAHELAHLAFWFLPDETRASFVALYEREREIDWAFGEYQRGNVDEFFAVSYQDRLRERHARLAAPRDSAGAWGRVCAWFDALEAR